MNDDNDVRIIPLSTRIKDLRARHGKWLPLLFFAAGFCFDAVMLRRIDDPVVIVQQAAYLVVSSALIALNMTGYAPRSPSLAKLWHYHEELLHFLLGTLLNAYTIFYFKAASLFTSVVFLLGLCLLLYVNESKALRGRGSAVRLMILSLCLTSYLVCVVPIALGRIGVLPFLLAIAASIVAAAPLYVFLRSRGLGRHLIPPFVGTQLLFLLLYFTEVIPPVPLSVKSMAVYHGLTKENGRYVLTLTRPWWKFWQHGDQVFAARPGDHIYFFVRVFSPTNFKERLQVRWLHQEPGGWHAWDAIPLPVTGGRDEGYRGYMMKSHYEPGEWRVQVETHDGRELGRYYFSVVRDETVGARQSIVEVE